MSAIRQGPSRIGVAGALLALLLYVPLLAMRPRDETPTRWRRPSSPLLRYWPVAESDPVTSMSDVRVIWSPVLFSLPSRVGFRSPSRDMPSAERQPDLSGRPVAQLTPPSPTSPRLRVVTDSPSGVVAVPPIRPPRAFTSDAPLRLVPQIVVVGDSLRTRRPETEWTVPQIEFARSWSVTLWMRFDEAGQATNILLEQWTPDDAPETLAPTVLRAARQWQIPPGPPAEGRVIVRTVFAPIPSNRDTP